MKKQLLLGYDIGSSSIKASLLDADSGKLVSSAFSPEVEMKMASPMKGWAEQDPEMWWSNLKIATQKAIKDVEGDYEIKSIGISYQMHGLVLVDKNQKVLHPSIIWCDSRAVDIGNKAFKELGEEFCLSNYHNSPGNFTMSKLLWVKENKQDVYKKIYKFMLPGDYIAMKLTGKINTTVSGLSEGVFWNFKENRLATELFEKFDLNQDFVPDIVPTYSVQGTVTKQAAEEVGIHEGIPVAYRAGDQPNNAFSLNVLNPGEIAATAGTSGVVYGVTDKNIYDKQSRVNLFAHVNYSKETPNEGVLLCINGTAILYQWLRNTIFDGNYTYEEMNELGENVPIGSDGLLVIPFGNGAERTLNNKNIQAQFLNIDFNKHRKDHIINASLEGIACAFNYGLEIMKEMGMTVKSLRVGNANLFLSDLFRKIVSNICDLEIEIYNTDGAQGAARGGGVGAGIYKSFDEAFRELSVVATVTPSKENTILYNDVYTEWKKQLEIMLKK